MLAIFHITTKEKWSVQLSHNYIFPCISLLIMSQLTIATKIHVLCVCVIPFHQYCS